MGNRITTHQEEQVTKHKLLALIVFVLASSFYLYEFILQVSPAVMTQGMMRDFHVHAAGLGIIASAYFYSYTPMQIPAGMLYDRYGPRLLMTIAVILCTLGCLFFGFTENRWLAAIGRVFMGVGSAFSFIGTLVLASRWFASHHYAFLVGIAQALSSVGAILGAYPLAYSVAEVGWRNTMFILAAIGFVLAIIIFLIVRDYPPDVEPEDTSDVDAEHEIYKLIHVCRNPQSWLAALYAFFAWAPVVVFAGLWGVPYLVSIYGVTEKIAALYTSAIWVGIAVGATSLGWWSDAIKCRNKPMKIASVIGLVCMTTLIIWTHMPIVLLLVIMFGFGFAASGESITFAVVKDNNFSDHLGTASGFNNMATVAGGVFIQPLIGIFLDMLWDGKLVNSVPFYTTLDYRIAFMILPVCYIFAWILSTFFIEETHCRHNPHSQTKSLG